MNQCYQRIDELKAQISSLERRLTFLKAELAQAEDQLSVQHCLRENRQNGSEVPDHFFESSVNEERPHWRWPLLQSEYRRFSRQLIVPEVGLQGQLRLKSAAVLIVGVGGLGCPAAAYLAGAGIGTIGLFDGDVVEESNLHRQILHSAEKIGMNKAESAIQYLRLLNSTVKYNCYPFHLTAEIANQIFPSYDVVLDCTDHPSSRYLISDACVIYQKPLVSASALRMEGQLMVLNNPPRRPGDSQGGPCYRCVFPKPPPPESVVSCGEGGILGPVVGAMGVLQALETIKLITSGSLSQSARGKVPEMTGDESMNEDVKETDSCPAPASPTRPSLLLFSATPEALFRTIRLRPRRSNCAACSLSPTISAHTLATGTVDYVRFCGTVEPIDQLRPDERVSARGYAHLALQDEMTGAKRAESSSLAGKTETERGEHSHNHVLVDVREPVHFELASIRGSINIPFSTLSTFEPSSPIGSAQSSSPEETPAPIPDRRTDAPVPSWLEHLRRIPYPIYVICRLGNDSQLAVRKMQALGLDNGGKRYIGDVAGGLKAWRNETGNFPDI